MLAKSLALPRRAAITVAALAFTLLAGAGGAEAQQKFAVINVQKVLSESAAGKAAQVEIEGLQESKRSGLEAQKAEIDSIRARIEQGKLSLAQDKLDELSKEAQQKIIALQRAEDDANRELQEKGEKLMAGIENQILPVINQIGKDGGYTMIFNKFQSGLVYADDAVDITAQVISRLNAQTPAAGG